MSPLASTQMPLQFDLSLLERFPTKLDYIASLILTHRDHQKTIAANLDIAPSTLTRKLNPGEDNSQRFTLNDEDKLYRAYPDIAKKAVAYDVAKWCDTPEAKLQRLVNNLEARLAEQNALASEIKELKEMLK